MPVLNNDSKLERVYLPSFSQLPEDQQAFVDIEVGKITAGDVIGIDPEKSDTESALRMLANRIKGWNLTDASGQELEINFENVSKLDVNDFAFLAEKIGDKVEKLPADQKKT
jgi:hypothetical protein